MWLLCCLPLVPSFFFDVLLSFQNRQAAQVGKTWVFHVRLLSRPRKDTWRRSENASSRVLLYKNERSTNYNYIYKTIERRLLLLLLLFVRRVDASNSSRQQPCLLLLLLLHLRLSWIFTKKMGSLHRSLLIMQVNSNRVILLIICGWIFLELLIK